jgi:hypothetical protein
MKSARNNLHEAGIREKLSMLERWRASGLLMTAWAQGQGLDVDEGHQSCFARMAAVSTCTTCSIFRSSRITLS